MAASDSFFQTTSAHGPHLDVHNILQHGSFPHQRGPSEDSTGSSSEAAMRRPRISPPRPKTGASSSSRMTTTSTSTRTDNRTAQRVVRTLPPWIDSFEEGEEVIAPRPPTRFLASMPRAHEANHHFAPSTPARRISHDGYVDTYEDPPPGANERRPETGFFGGYREPVRGRKWDHARDGDPVIMQAGRMSTGSPWRTYIKSTMYGPAANEDPRRVDEAFLEQQTPGYLRPWRGDLDGVNDPEKLTGLLYNKKQRRTFLKRAQHILLLHPLVPLVFRMIVFTTSVIALALSASVHKLSDTYRFPQNPSTTMAIVVDVIAIPYILWITWDEYTGKPLGLRSPKAKIRLVLIDLFFIIFESANIALAFAALNDREGSCKVGMSTGSNYIVCGRVKALCGILMVAIVAWSLTFATSIFRLVERVGGREEGD